VDRYLVSAERRRAAYFEVASERGLPLTEWRAPERPGADGDFLTAWIATPPQERPTAALCWNDIAAHNLVAECRLRGVRVPEDLAVAGFDGDPSPRSLPWRLTTVRAPWAEVARTAVQLLITQLEGEAIPRETVLPVTLIAGDSA
jgi:DNA-binding LacI/PurR family transcriptional regulator